MKSTLSSWMKSAQLKAIMVMMFVFNAYAVFAQVTITVDTDPIFTETNSWITVFTPIVAIGIGISIALAILTFIGREIVNAFRSGGKR